MKHSTLLDAERKARAAESLVIKKIAPGQPGSKRWQAKYGEALLCVRYRALPGTHKRLTTVEIVVDEREFAPLSSGAPADAHASQGHEPRPPLGHTLMPVRVGWQERAVQQSVKAAGGKWDPKECVWMLRYDQIKALGLEGRVVGYAY